MAKNVLYEIKHGNTFETSEVSLVELSITSVNRRPPTSNINDYTKIEDNRSQQSGLREHTSFKNGWLHPMSHINDYTKLEDNRSQQSGLRAHTSFKNGWLPF